VTVRSTINHEILPVFSTWVIKICELKKLLNGEQLETKQNHTFNRYFFSLSERNSQEEKKLTFQIL